MKWGVIALLIVLGYVINNVRHAIINRKLVEYTGRPPESVREQLKMMVDWGYSPPAWTFMFRLASWACYVGVVWAWVKL